jgi:hypothetical protein
MIALEALLLRDMMDDRGGLSFCAAMRAVQLWPVSRTDFTPAKVFDLMRRAYDYRSTISHGASVDGLRTCESDRSRVDVSDRESDRSCNRARPLHAARRFRTSRRRNLAGVARRRCHKPLSQAQPRRYRSAISA